MNLIYRGIVTGYINSQQQKPVVFNGQCNFAYKISPWIKKGVSQIELIHSLNSFSYIRIPYLPFISKTIMISQKRINDHKELYQKCNIPSELLNRISYIPNAIALPGQTFSKNNNSFTVLYAGRSTEEKRTHLLYDIAKKVTTENPNIDFEIMGDVKMALEKFYSPISKWYGKVRDQKIIDEIYSHAHVLILTSTTEGFPMVIIEAMAHGCVILSTAIGDIPHHVKNNVNGFLFSNTDDEALIIKEASEKIVWLKNNRSELNRMATTNIEYARHNFGIDRFDKDYRELFQSVNPGN